MQSFDEITEKQINLVNEALTVGFKSGAQSRQQEVDKLQTEIDTHISRRLELSKDKESLIKKIDELQKRIDELSEINETITDELVVYRSRFGKGETNE